MAKSSFYSSTGVTPDNPDVTPVEPNNINAIEDSKNAAAASATQAEASKVAAAQSASDANAAKLAAQAVQADVEDAETNSAASATAAASSAASAATSLAGIGNSETNAATSASNSATSASAAAASALSASSSATSAASDAASAATSLSNIGSAEANAAASATSAASSASSASTDAASASASQVAAAASEAAAATSEANSATSETNAATSASQAATSAANSATSETNAATSASSASTSASNAASSASAASASQVAAAASAASAANAYDTFDDRYLGSKTADPTVDNDGNALVQGSLYFNSTANEMRVYDGGSWIAASSAGGASLLEYKYTATAAQTTFSGADDNANTLNYTQDNLIVTLNGVVLENGADYTATTGTSVVLASGAAASDELNVIAFKSFATADMVPASTGGTFYGNVAINGDLTVDTNTLYVDSTNNRIGVGTASPSGKLQIEGTTDHLKLTYPSIASYILDVKSNGDFAIDKDGSERMRIDSSGNLLVGMTSNGITSTGIGLVRDGTSHMYSGGTHTLELGRGTNDGDILKFNRSGTTVGSIGVSSNILSIVGKDGNGGLAIQNNTFGDIIYPASNTTGGASDNAIDLGYSSGRFKDLYLSGGVYLGGVGSSNKLDDYEEGTWDPAWGGDSDPTVSYTNQNGWYVKVGNLVWCGGTIHTSSASGGSGNLLIRGLPFYSASDQANELSTMCVGYANNFGTNYPTAGYMGRNRTFVNVTSVDRSTGTALMQTSYLTNTSYMNFNITYTTD